MLECFFLEIFRRGEWGSFPIQQKYCNFLTGHFGSKLCHIIEEKMFEKQRLSYEKMKEFKEVYIQKNEMKEKLWLEKKIKYSNH